MTNNRTPNLTYWS